MDYKHANVKLSFPADKVEALEEALVPVNTNPAIILLISQINKKKNGPGAGSKRNPEEGEMWLYEGTDKRRVGWERVIGEDVQADDYIVDPQYGTRAWFVKDFSQKTVTEKVTNEDGIEEDVETAVTVLHTYKALDTRGDGQKIKEKEFEGTEFRRVKAEFVDKPVIKVKEEVVEETTDEEVPTPIEATVDAEINNLVDAVNQ